MSNPVYECQNEKCPSFLIATKTWVDGGLERCCACGHYPRRRKPSVIGWVVLWGALSGAVLGGMASGWLGAVMGAGIGVAIVLVITTVALLVTL